jgi:uncharacterized protein YndB with AHSA1/START domain
MSVTSVDTDFDELTLTLVADFAASADAVWELWADPRKLERWWGPPGYPATFEQHDLSEGSETVYFMTNPEGGKHYGWWRIESVNPPRSVEITDGFADDEGKPNPDMPTGLMTMELSDHDGGTRMTLRSVFPSRDAMQELLDMGQAEGMREAAGQMDAILAE